MGFFEWLKLSCVKCGAVTLKENATMTECCQKKLCDATCYPTWVSDVRRMSKCPYCGKPFKPGCWVYQHLVRIFTLVSRRRA
jgi:hypothetical protein